MRRLRINFLIPAWYLMRTIESLDNSACSKIIVLASSGAKGQVLIISSSFIYLSYHSLSTTRVACHRSCSPLPHWSFIGMCLSILSSGSDWLFSSVFRTSHRDPSINETSSYVDLAPLYGNNQKDQDKIRIRNGRGKIAPDSFCEDRLLLLPPAVCTLLVLFSRNHNVSMFPFHLAFWWLNIPQKVHRHKAFGNQWKRQL